MIGNRPSAVTSNFYPCRVRLGRRSGEGTSCLTRQAHVGPTCSGLRRTRRPHYGRECVAPGPQARASDGCRWSRGLRLQGSGNCSDSNMVGQAHAPASAHPHPLSAATPATEFNTRGPGGNRRSPCRSGLDGVRRRRPEGPADEEVGANRRQAQRPQKAAEALSWVDVPIAH